MDATLVEHRIGDVRWLVASGERATVFRALGEHARAQIATAVTEMPELSRLRERIGRVPWLTAHLDAVRAASRSDYPRAWEELEELARGAGADGDDLALLNLRGDLGTDDGTGCSDLAYSCGTQAYLAHNEDGSAALDGLCYLLTLRIAGEPSVTVWWYPGFLPANTCVVTGNGLVWGIDHVGITMPARAAGRHFVARGLQRSPTVDEAAAYLRDRHSAGGFAYTIGAAGQARITTVETGAKYWARSDLGSEAAALSWHTNHLRLLPAGMDVPSTSSLSRGELLDDLRPPPRPTVDWPLSALTGPLAGEAHSAGGQTVTLCTLVADLTGGIAVLRPRGGAPIRLPLADLAAGRTDRAIVAGNDAGAGP